MKVEQIRVYDGPNKEKRYSEICLIISYLFLSNYQLKLMEKLYECIQKTTHYFFQNL